MNILFINKNSNFLYYFKEFYLILSEIIRNTAIF